MSVVSTSSDAFQRAWCDAVDATAAMSTLAPLDPAAEYDPSSYLPALPASLDESVFFEHLRGRETEVAAITSTLYFPQMTETEACHAKPSFYDSFRGEREVMEAVFYPSPHMKKNEENALVGGKRPSRRHRTETTTRGPAPVWGGFLGLNSLSPVTIVQLKPNFLPIILLPAASTAPLQLVNIKLFLERGEYVDPSAYYIDQETGAPNLRDAKPRSVVVKPGSFHDPHKYNVAFRQFRVLDDPKEVQDWSHVCGCVVEGKLWQLQGWYPGEPALASNPSGLFTRIRAFLAYFEEDKVPPQCREWRVQSLPLTRNLLKEQTHIALASSFWEQLYTFLEEHPMFRNYTIPLSDER